MTRADLKTGMIVEIEDNKRLCLVIGNALVDLSIKEISIGGKPLRTIKDDLTDVDAHISTCKNWTINKVYAEHTDYSGSGIFHKLTHKDRLLGRLIWKRKPKPIEMTLEQVCNILGQEIKIIPE